MKVGANLERMENLHKFLGRQNNQFTNRVEAVLASLDSVDWFGPEAERFKTSSGQEIRQQLAELVALLDEAATTIETQRSEQADASGV